jgi:PAS domain S-box-containing protein
MVKGSRARTAGLSNGGHILNATQEIEGKARERIIPNGVLKVFLVEDNPGDVALMEEMLSEARSARFEFSSVSRLKEALQRMETISPDVILLDLGLPDSAGLATLQSMLEGQVKAPIIVLTGLSDSEMGVQAVTMGAQDYLVKGEVDAPSLERAIKHSIQRKHILDELNESNERYVSLFHDNYAVMLLIDPVNGRVVDANQAASQYYGYDIGQLKELGIEDINTLPSDKIVEKIGLASSRTQGNFLFKHRLADGQERDVEVISGPIYIKGRTYLYSIVHDITDRKRAEEERARLTKEVEEQRGLLQTVIDNTPAGILALSGPDLTVMWANNAFAEICGLGCGSEPLGGKMLRDIPCPSIGLTERVRSVLNSKVPTTESEIETPSVTGRTSFLHTSIVPIALKGGEDGVLVLLMNVTDQVIARQRIEEMAVKADEERRRLRAILDNLPVGVTVVDQRGKMIESNDLVDTIWGGRVPPLYNLTDYRELKGWWADNGLAVRPEEWPVVKAVNKGEATVGAVIDIMRMDGTRGTILSSASPIKDPMSRVIGGVGVIQDITIQRKLEHDAIEAKEQAELYIDLLSHDISNMNAAVSGYLQTAVEKIDIEQKSLQYFTKSQEILENSNNLIETVRKIQKVENHESKYGLVDLGWLLEDVRGEFEHYPGREVKITYKTTIKKFVMASDLLKDVFTNLLSNSIKHSTGPVEISIVLNKAFEGGREHYKVTVEDDGPGIPDELKMRLFQRKQRGKTKTTGSGLGLYLVKKLVEDINGRVWLEDRVPGEPSKGTKFVVLLPAVTNNPKPMI